MDSSAKPVGWGSRIQESAPVGARLSSVEVLDVLFFDL